MLFALVALLLGGWIASLIIGGDTSWLLVVCLFLNGVTFGMRITRDL